MKLATRKRLKAYLERLVTPVYRDRIDASLAAQPAAKGDILIFGLINFDFRFQRPQQLARSLASNGFRVFYIEPEFLPSDLVHAPISLEALSNNLYVVRLSADRNYFIYDDCLSKGGGDIIIQSLSRLLELAGIHEPTAIIEHPFWQQIPGIFDGEMSSRTIYDCLDDHSGFTETGPLVPVWEQALFRVADQTVVTSHALYQKAQLARAKQIAVIPNGIDDRFLQVFPEAKPAASSLLYVGAVEAWFDDALLEQILKKYSGLAVTLAGQVRNLKVSQLAKRYRHLKLLGERPAAEIPGLINSASVCLIPFLDNSLTRAVHPLKFFEYLALGKPVVSFALPELNEFGDIAYLAHNHQEFLESIDIGLQENNPVIVGKRIAVAQVNTWSHRVSQWLQILNK